MDRATKIELTERPRAILLLEDGTLYEGLAGGKIGTAVGEICFNTGMTGYQEIFTDPSYYGQNPGCNKCSHRQLRHQAG